MSLAELKAEKLRIEQEIAKELQAELAPMKERYAKMIVDIEKLEKDIKDADPSWSPTPRRIDLLIGDAMEQHRKELPATAKTIYSWLNGTKETLDKVTSVLNNRSTGERPKFTKDGDNYGLKGSK